MYCFGDLNFNYLVPIEIRAIDRLLTSFHLRQLVDQPTRVTPVSKSAIVFISRNTNSCKQTSISILPLFASDHSIVMVTVSKPSKRTSVFKTKLLYEQTHFEALSHTIDLIEWNFIHDIDRSFDDIVEQFMITLQSAFKLHIPTKHLNSVLMTRPGITMKFVAPLAVVTDYIGKLHLVTLTKLGAHGNHNVI